MLTKRLRTKKNGRHEFLIDSGETELVTITPPVCTWVASDVEPERPTIHSLTRRSTTDFVSCANSFRNATGRERERKPFFFFSILCANKIFFPFGMEIAVHSFFLPSHYFIDGESVRSAGPVMLMLLLHHHHRRRSHSVGLVFAQILAQSLLLGVAAAVFDAEAGQKGEL